MPDIILKDENGNDIAYEGIRTVTFNGVTSGEKVTFNYGVLTEKEAELDMTAGDQVVSSEEGELLTKTTIKKPNTLIPDNIKKNVNIGGVVGTFIGNTEQRLTGANFADGDMVIRPYSADKVFDVVTIKKPETLLPENIKAGVSVAGVLGAYQLSGLPTLYAPTAITRGTNADGLQYLRITNPTASNGKFASAVQIVQESNGELVIKAQKAFTPGSSSVDVYGYDWLSLDTVYITVDASARFIGDGFNPSTVYTAKISGTAILSMYITYDYQNITASVMYPRLYYGDKYSFTLTPDSNFYLPKSIDMSVASGTPPAFTYDPDTGIVIIPNFNVIAALHITAIAVAMPWLKEPDVSISDNIMSIVMPSHSKTAKILLDGVEIAEEISLAPGCDIMSVEGATYGFIKNGDYYVSQNKGVSNSYALCKVIINAPKATVVTLNCISYGESNYDFGILSELDKTLTKSYSVDTTNVKKSFKGLASAAVQPVSYSVPEGEHFIYIKYRKDSSTNSNYDTLQFNVVAESSAVTVDLRTVDALKDYDTYLLQVVATAEGYTDSDPVDIEYIHTAQIEMYQENDVLIANGFENITQVDNSLEVN